MRLLKKLFSLKSKLLLLSSSMLLLPLLGYQYVSEMENFLRAGQEQTMLGTAKAVATALHERPALFDQSAAYQQQVIPTRDLYAYALSAPVKLDGQLNEWASLDKYQQNYDHAHRLAAFSDTQISSLSFSQKVGQYQQHLYLAISVKDDVVVLRPNNSYAVDKNDYLQISILKPDTGLQRYIFAASNTSQLNLQTGQWVNAFAVDENNRAELPEKQVQGYWRNTTQGYDLELRLPISWVGAKVGFAIFDVDDVHSRELVGAIGNADELGTILVPSPEIDAIIKGLSYHNSRIWVVDKHGRVLARSGDIQQATSTYQTSNTSAKFLQQMQSLLQPVYDAVLTHPSKHFIDQLKDAVKIDDQALKHALIGKADTAWRLTPDKAAVILSAAHPIYIDGQVLGAVVIEETTHGIRTLRNQSLQNLFNQMVLLLLVGSCIFLLFALRISGRIQNLKKQLGLAVDAQGRILTKVKPEKQFDEIGDLSRSVSDLVERLSQYNRYLESMSSRMSHEFKTPIAIIASSLEALKVEQTQLKDNEFFQRAEQGMQRLNSMLAAMTEATRLEQAIQHSHYLAQKEPFDFAAVVQGCVMAHQQTFPNQQFKLIEMPSDYQVIGSPDLIVQMLEKILANAIDFANPNSEIEIKLVRDKKQLVLSIFNQGPLLPEQMAANLFNSMVSVRDSDSQQTHLGLGLYIARLVSQFHHGQISAYNQHQPHQGVVIEFMMKVSE
ncbi:proteobacterial dedicated sortase system histidine kinase [Catenovulum agarivorans]|uniref:proteobacterial dedicated sortase system histidine kinase n=1 Tax=Catenovulum agarivorans TaxID=1172192 RepID=UPI000308D949|nr:proteobacterial dedicated sortase system histidine kinase [Catenovulum agarivorans]